MLASQPSLSRLRAGAGITRLTLHIKRKLPLTVNCSQRLFGLSGKLVTSSGGTANPLFSHAQARTQTHTHTLHLHTPTHPTVSPRPPVFSVAARSVLLLSHHPIPTSRVSLPANKPTIARIISRCSGCCCVRAGREEAWVTGSGCVSYFSYFTN